MKLSHLPVAAVLAGFLILSGCAYIGGSQQLYQLDSGTVGSQKRDSGIAVVLGPVEVANYLERDTLVQRQADNSISINSNARWASSLPEDINQVLMRQMASRLKTNRLVLSSDQAGFEPDVQLAVNINRLDSGPQKPAVLEAQWRLLDKNGKLRDSEVVKLEEKHDGTTSDQVRAQSVLLQRFAADLSKAVQTNNARIAAAAKQADDARKREASIAKPPSSRQIPVVEPVRNRGEILRF